MQNRIIKFCTVGALGTIIDISLLFFFVEILHLSIIISNSLSFSITMIISFLSHRLWTFRNNNSKCLRQFLTYLIVSLIGLGISNAFLFVLVMSGLWYLYAKIVTVFMVVFWSYSANNFFTFARNKQVAKRGSI